MLPFRSQCGPLGTLQVDSNHRQRGLGSLVTKAITKQLSGLDMDTYAMVTWEILRQDECLKKLVLKLLTTVIMYGQIHWSQRTGMTWTIIDICFCV